MGMPCVAAGRGTCLGEEADHGTSHEGEREGDTPAEGGVCSCLVVVLAVAAAEKCLSTGEETVLDSEVRVL